MSYLSYKGLFGYSDKKSYVLFKIVNSLFQMMFFTMLSSYIFKSKDCSFWIIGNAFMLSICNSLFGVGLNSTYERVFGTLKYSVVAKESILEKYITQMFPHILDGILSILLGLGFGILFFGLHISYYQFLLLIITACIAMISTCCFSLIIGNLGLIIRDMNMIVNVVNMLVMICSGVNYSLNSLPKFMQVISKIMPLTRTILAARKILKGEYLNIVYLLAGEFGMGVIYLLIAAICSKVIEHVAVKYARIDLL